MSDINKEILVVGLGSMGLGIAQSLLREGYKVYGQDKNSIQTDKFIKNGGEKGAKEAGKLRSEGKEYIVQDGDVMHFLFNV